MTKVLYCINEIIYAKMKPRKLKKPRFPLKFSIKAQIILKKGFKNKRTKVFIHLELFTQIINRFLQYT